MIESRMTGFTRIGQSFALKLNQSTVRQADLSQGIKDPSYCFQNFTGIPGTIAVSGDIFLRQTSKSSGQIKPKLSSENLVESSVVIINSTKKPYYQPMKDVEAFYLAMIKEKTHGKTIEAYEKVPLTFDMIIDGYQLLENIQVEAQGTYSYKIKQVQRTTQSVGFMGTKTVTSTPLEFGFICNVKMEGKHKQVNFESTLIISNQSVHHMRIGYAPQAVTDKVVVSSVLLGQEEVQANSIFQVPLNWFVANYTIFIQREDGKFIQLIKTIKNSLPLTANLQQPTFTPEIFESEKHVNISTNLSAFLCQSMTLTSELAPLQYVITLAPPLCITNLTMNQLDAVHVRSEGKELIVSLQTQESGFIYKLSGNKPIPAEWNIAHSKNQWWSQKKEIDIKSKLGLSTETFNVLKNGMIQSDKKCSINFEYQWKTYLKLSSYCENFNNRNKVVDLNSAMHLVISPSHIVINKNLFNIKIGEIEYTPLQIQYAHMPKAKSEFKVAGFKSSKPLDLTTIGMAGQIDLKRDNEKDANKTINYAGGYAPKLLKIGLLIKTAPAPFHRTIVIELVPRYAIINKTGKKLVIRETQVDSPGMIVESNAPHFFYFMKKTAQSMIQIRDLDDEESKADKISKHVVEDLMWSSPFSLDNIDDFQIGFPGITQMEENSPWYRSSPDNGYLNFVRASVTTKNEATILIVLSNPSNPEYNVVNSTPFEMQYRQENTGTLYTMQPFKKVPFVWQNKSIENKKFELIFDGKSEHLNIDKVLKKKELVTNLGTIQFEVIVTGISKKVVITCVDDYPRDKRDASNSKFAQMLSNYSHMKQNVSLNLAGVGLAMLNSEPREINFTAIQDIRLELNRFDESKMDDTGHFQENTKLKITVGHVQIDNMLDKGKPVILAPVGSQSETITEVEEKVPFLQFQVNLAVNREPGLPEVLHLKMIQLQVQELNVAVDTYILSQNLQFLSMLATILSKKEFQEKQSHKIGMFGDYSYNEYHLQHQPINEVCNELNPDTPVIGQEEGVTLKKMYIELVHLGAIKIIVSFKLEDKAFMLDENSAMNGFKGTSLVYSAFSRVINISDSPLSFKELIITNVFTSVDVLGGQIAKNYARQGIMQFYRLFGSSDMIGNPMGLVDKMGSGVFEFFNEPRKGIIQGPEQFVGGVGRGVKGLVSNVVQGSFDSVSKITGSLYGTVKNVTGQEETKQGEYQPKPKHIGEGITQGVKGGVGEVIEGVTGLFTKPVKMTKQEGAKGFFKGVASGLAGAVSAPVTGVLKAGTNISEGVSSSAKSIGNKGKLMIEDVPRVRPPRIMSNMPVLKKFDPNLNKVSAILSKTKWKNQNILHHGEVFKEEKKSNGLTLVITATHFLLFDANQKIAFKSNQEKLASIKVVKKSGSTLQLDIQATKKKISIFSDNSDLMLKAFDILAVNEKCAGHDEIRK